MNVTEVSSIGLSTSNAEHSRKLCKVNLKDLFYMKLNKNSTWCDNLKKKSFFNTKIHIFLLLWSFCVIKWYYLFNRF